MVGLIKASGPAAWFPPIPTISARPVMPALPGPDDAPLTRDERVARCAGLDLACASGSREWDQEDETRSLHVVNHSCSQHVMYHSSAAASVRVEPGRGAISWCL